MGGAFGRFRREQHPAMRAPTAQGHPEAHAESPCSDLRVFGLDLVPQWPGGTSNTSANSSFGPPTDSPRRGDGIKPGASAPGRVGKKSKRPEGARLGIPPPLQGGFFFTSPTLGLKPQAVFLRPFGARARLKDIPRCARYILPPVGSKAHR